MPQITSAHLCQILTIVVHMACRGTVKLDDRTPGGCFPASTFPYQAQRLTPVNVKTDVVHRLDIANMARKDNTPRNGKILLEALYPDQNAVICHEVLFLPSYPFPNKLLCVLHPPPPAGASRAHIALQHSHSEARRDIRAADKPDRGVVLAPRSA